MEDGKEPRQGKRERERKEDDERELGREKSGEKKGLIKLPAVI